jgi:putative transposase
MQRKLNFSIDEYYHIYSRGVDKRNIFIEKNDYNRFLFLMYLCNSNNPVNISKLFEQVKFKKGPSFSDIFLIDKGENIVDIGVYCLMPNHFHLLLREKQDNGISLFIKKLLTGYSMYFNKKHKRSGALFENRFKANHVSKDEYLKYLFSYIHLNPIKIINEKWKENTIFEKEKSKNFLNSYNYSSYLDYLGKDRIESKILQKGSFPEFFDTNKSFENFIDDWLNYKTTETFDEN